LLTHAFYQRAMNRYLRAAFMFLGVFAFCGVSAAESLGVTGGRLAPCPYAPRCVSSQAPETDTRHYIVPLTYTATRADALIALKAAAATLPRQRLVSETDGYLRYEFTSRLIGYVDDVEFHFDENDKRVHVRSSGRIGWWDGGVNRERVEQIRREFLMRTAVQHQ
jgi:uncharacterized protein (DUF1499 family)